MTRGKTSGMACVHGLEHVQGLFSPHLAHYDAVGIHAQGRLNQLAHGNFPFSLRIGVPCLQTHQIRNLCYLQFGRIFNGNNTLTGGAEG
mgnify:CR=1 FL=1